MTTPNVTSSTDSQMHNNIMAAGSRDRPPMLAGGRYPQWRSRFLRYIDTRPNGEDLRKCILSGPYKPTTVLVQAVEATNDSLAILEHITVETPMNMSPENKAHFEAEKEAIHLILTGIRDEIHSTVDACQTIQEMWEAIERFYKLMNEMVRNTLTIDTIHKGKEIAKLITPPSETASEEDGDPEQAKRDKDMQKNLALIAKKPKRVKDSVYDTEKMLLCKQAEQGVSLQAEQYDWLADTDEEVDEQELEAHYSYMAKIQEVPTANSGTDSEPMEQNEQNDVESDDEHVALANLKLDVDENQKIQNKSLEESISVQDSCMVVLQSKQTEFEKYKAFNDRTIDYDKLERKLNETLGKLAQKDIEIKEEIVDNAWIKHSKDQFRAPTAQDIEILIQTCLMPLATKTQNDSFRFVHELKQEMHADLKYIESLEKEIDELESDKAEFSDMYDVILQECVSKDVMCSYLMSLSDLDVLHELQCLYLHKVKECDCLAQKLSNQTDTVSKEFHSELLKHFAKV
nr:hypothetical protein [Tanacetum cinerariifolium]